MKLHQLLFTTLIIFSCFKSNAQLPSPPEGKRWVLNEPYSDEFNGTELDDSKWYDKHPYWVGRPPAIFLEKNVSVQNGNLQIKNNKLEQDTTVTIFGTDYTYNIGAGAVVSKAQNALYGYYEVRMKASKISMSSTFWLKNLDEQDGCVKSKTELDIIEAIGGAKRFPSFATQMKSNTHIFYTDCNGVETDYDVGGEGAIGGNAADAYHTYGAWWRDANNIDFYIDGTYSHSISPSTEISGNPFNRPMWVNMVTETYDFEINPTDAELADDTRNTTYYDYVRAYSLVDVDEVPEEEPILVNGGFETGDLTGWTGFGNPREVVTTNVYSGTYAVRVIGGGAPEQIVNLKPNTQYELSAYTSVIEGSGDIAFGVKENVGNANLGISFVNETEYTQKKISFTTDEKSQVKIFFFAQPGEEGYADEFKIVEVGASNEPGVEMPLEELIDYTVNPIYDAAANSINTVVEYKARLDREIKLSLYESTDGLIDEFTITALAGYGKKGLNFELDTALESSKSYFLKAELLENGEASTSLAEVSADLEKEIVEQIQFAEDIDSLTVAQSYTFNVAYAAKESRDIVVEIWSSPTQWFGAKRITVAKGEATVPVTVTLNSLPPAGNAYVLKVSIRPVGTNFLQNIQLKEIKNVVMSVPVTGISFDENAFVLKVNESLSIPYSINPSDATNKTVTWSTSDEGIASVDENGLVTAINAGVATIKATTEDGGFSDSAQISIQGAYLGNTTIPGIVEAENYDFGGSNVAYFDTSVGNSGEVYRNDDVDIEFTTDHAGNYHIKDIEAGEWLEYTVDVENAGNYYLSARVMSNSFHSGLTFDFNEGVSVSTLNINQPLDTWTTISSPNSIYLEAGTNQVRVDAIGQLMFNYFEIELVPTECLSVPAWDSHRTYTQAGTEVLFNGFRYTSKYYTNRKPGTDNSWKLEGSCGATKQDCFDLPTWNASTTYPSNNTFIVHQTKLYKSKWYASQGQQPGVANVWELVGTCTSASLETPPSACPTNSSPWNSQTVYNNNNTYVTYEGLLYFNKWYASANQKPGVANVWEVERACSPTNSDLEFATTSKNSFATADSLKVNDEKLSLENQLIIYPNPVADSFYFKNELNEDIQSISIYSYTGNLVHEEAGGNGKAISITQLPSGVYLVVIETENKTIKRKIVKE